MAELASQKVFVLSMVADNASAMQSAMNSFTAASRDHDVDNDDETPEALLESLCSFEGVFIFRCAAHSLQLCMKDIQKEIPVITTAATVVEKLVGYYEKFSEKAADLQSANAIPSIGKHSTKNPGNQSTVWHIISRGDEHCSRDLATQSAQIFFATCLILAAVLESSGESKFLEPRGKGGIVGALGHLYSPLLYCTTTGI